MGYKKLLIKYLKEYRKEINCRSLKRIGEGSMGVAYRNETKYLR